MKGIKHDTRGEETKGPGIATRSKDATRGIATRSKDATRGSWHRAKKHSKESILPKAHSWCFWPSSGASGLPKSLGCRAAAASGASMPSLEGRHRELKL